MKAHYRMPASKEVRQLSKKLLEEMAAERKKEQDQAISRTLKMVCVVLNQDFGFGEKRLEKFLDAVFDGGNEVVDRPEEWFHIDEKLSQIGIFFEPEDLDEREQHSRDLYHDQGRKFRMYEGEQT